MSGRVFTISLQCRLVTLSRIEGPKCDSLRGIVCLGVYSVDTTLSGTDEKREKLWLVI